MVIAARGHWSDAVAGDVADRITSLLMVPSGLEGAIGLCEAPLIASDKVLWKPGTVASAPAFFDQVRMPARGADGITECAAAIRAILLHQ